MIFRIARHTNNIQQLTNFYCNIIGLQLLGSFTGHDGYDGVFLGKKNADWHLEFTQNNQPANHVFDEDDVLVFYPETEAEYNQITVNIHTGNIPVIQPKNPYWKINGICIHDPDGYIIIISPVRTRSHRL